MHAMAKMAKNRQPLTNFELDAKSVPLESRLAILTKSLEGWGYPRNVANMAPSNYITKHVPISVREHHQKIKRSYCYEDQNYF